MTVESADYEWIDFPEPGFFTGPWGWGHTIGCGIATFLYVIPGLIYLIAYALGDSSYKRRRQVAIENHDQAFERTKCRYLATANHNGGHPRIPFNSRVLLGLTAHEVRFYTYKLNLLHKTPIEQVSARVKTEQNISGGPSYVTTTNKQTIIWDEVINGVEIRAEFDMGAYSPQEFIQSINELLVNA